jgi:uncharacterized membrane protein
MRGAPAPHTVRIVSNGLIYAVIVVLWAVVLLPMWLRRHDEVTESRSVDRFQGAMRPLSRRASAGDRREVLVPRRPTTRAVPDGASDQMSATAMAGRRRRRTLLALAGLTAVLAGLGAFAIVQLWTALLPFVLLLAFLAKVWITARRARSRDLAARRARAAAVRRERRAAVQEAVGPDGTLRVPPRRAVAARYEEASDPAPVQAEEQLAGLVGPAAAIPAAAAVAGLYDAVAERVWEPVPVPLPTYVLAAKAPRSVRVIDLSKPGHWTSGHLDPDERAELEEEIARSADAGATRSHRPDGIVTGEVLIQRRYAVGD